MRRSDAHPAGRRWLAVTAAILVAAGCSKDSGSEAGTRAAVITAATLGQQTVLSTLEYFEDPIYAQADVENGRRQAQLCSACHTLGEGGPVMLGPNLYGLFGARAGSRPGYEYSQVLANAGFIWTPRALEAWLAEPARFLPGNRMSFAGVLDPKKRADLVAYLLNVTDDVRKQEQ